MLRVRAAQDAKKERADNKSLLAAAAEGKLAEHRALDLLRASATGQQRVTTAQEQVARAGKLAAEAAMDAVDVHQAVHAASQKAVEAEVTKRTALAVSTYQITHEVWPSTTLAIERFASAFTGHIRHA